MAFPDRTKPIATCTSSSCDDCPVSPQVHCHFQLRDYLFFLILSSPGFIVGGAAVYRVSGWALLFYGIIAIGFFGFLEIRVMCSHCPHYAEAGATLTCWANHGSPKLWRYRPGPMSNAENLLFFAGLITIWGFPLPYLLLSHAWLLLVVYLIVNAMFFMMLKHFFCSKCMNFACPLNCVDDTAKTLFLQRNPSVAAHWPDGKSN